MATPSSATKRSRMDTSSEIIPFISISFSKCTKAHLKTPLFWAEGP